jgi:flavin-dependent dehydrogenase
LAERGNAVTVHDRATRLPPQPRTLIVTSSVKEILGSQLNGSLVNEIRRYELYADGVSANVELSQPDLVVERSTLIDSLARQAQALGAEIRLGERLVGMDPDDRGLTTTFEGSNGGKTRTSSAIVVGADGVNSTVARRGGWSQLPTVPVVQAVVRLPDDLAPDTTRVWFRPQDTPYFYWLIPESETTAVLGLIGDDACTARRHLDGFLDEKALPALSYQAARIPVYERWTPLRRRVANGEVFLVGDAAGHVKVTTVGGLQTGFRGAAAVGEYIDTGSRRQMRALRRELSRHQLIRRAIHGFDEDSYRSVIRLLGPRAQSTLGTYSRDESNKLLWRLCMREPRFFLLGLRGLLTGSRTRQSSDTALTPTDTAHQETQASPVS